MNPKMCTTAEAPVTIKTCEGLNVKVALLNEPRFATVADACRNQEGEETRSHFYIPAGFCNRHLVAEVTLKGAKIYLVYKDGIQRQTLLKQLARGVLSTQRDVLFEVYKDRAYIIGHQIAQILINSIKDKVHPNISALILK